jgi:hypothetical protein
VDWIGLAQGRYLVGLCGVLSNAAADSRLLRLHGLSAVNWWRRFGEMQCGRLQRNAIQGELH